MRTFVGCRLYAPQLLTALLFVISPPVLCEDDAKMRESRCARGANLPYRSRPIEAGCPPAFARGLHPPVMCCHVNRGKGPGLTGACGVRLVPAALAMFGRRAAAWRPLMQARPLYDTGIESSHRNRSCRRSSRLCEAAQDSLSSYDMRLFDAKAIVEASRPPWRHPIAEGITFAVSGQRRNFPLRWVFAFPSATHPYLHPS